MKKEFVCDYDDSIPRVEMNYDEKNYEYSVINLNDIERQVGLVEIEPNSPFHRATAPYMICHDSAKTTIGDPKDISN